jgi:hypothetical protein
MKPNSVIVFLGRRYELCKAFGLFGKDNLKYQSEFDHRIYNESDIIKYFFPELNCDIFFLSTENAISKLKIDEYNTGIIVVSESDIYNKRYKVYKQKYPNCKLIFLWMYGEVFSKELFEKCKEANLDLILSGSNQIGLNEIGIFDPKLNFKFFYYYIGYYYLTELVFNLKEKKYDSNKLPIFTYSKASNQSSWRSEILNNLHSKFPNKIYNGNSINDSYDLEFTKYKHFETINDYSYKNYNLVFETIDCRNNDEYFATEKTFKALFFANPFFLVAPSELIKTLSNEFYLLNLDFENVDEFVGTNDLDFKFEYFQKKAEVNHSKLLEYIKDYKYTEHFKKLLYG